MGTELHKILYSAKKLFCASIITWLSLSILYCECLPHRDTPKPAIGLPACPELFLGFWLLDLLHIVLVFETSQPMLVSMISQQKMYSVHTRNRMVELHMHTHTYA